jgi:hypothetical protein
MHAEFIVDALFKTGRVNARASYYSGRGARAGDLPPATLDDVYAALVKNVNEGAAGQFVQMVADIPVLSATDFLLALERFEYAGWKWVPEGAPDARGVHADDMGSAMGTVLEALGSSLPGARKRDDDTIRIRGGFLKLHMDELREDQKKKVKAEVTADRYDLFGRFPHDLHRLYGRG